MQTNKKQNLYTTKQRIEQNKHKTHKTPINPTKKKQNP